jgi:hypothetical protein
VKLWSLQAPKLQPRRCKLADFDFTIHHVPGVENKIPDALSRLHSPRKVQVQTVCPLTRSMSQVAINEELVDQIILHHNSLVGHIEIDELMFCMEHAGYRTQETSHDISDSTASML